MCAKLFCLEEEKKKETKALEGLSSPALVERVGRARKRGEKGGIEKISE